MGTTAATRRPCLVRTTRSLPNATRFTVVENDSRASLTLRSGIVRIVPNVRVADGTSLDVHGHDLSHVAPQPRRGRFGADHRAERERGPRSARSAVRSSAANRLADGDRRLPGRLIGRQVGEDQDAPRRESRSLERRSFSVSPAPAQVRADPHRPGGYGVGSGSPASSASRRGPGSLSVSIAP